MYHRPRKPMCHPGSYPELQCPEFALGVSVKTWLMELSSTCQLPSPVPRGSEGGMRCCSKPHPLITCIVLVWPPPSLESSHYWSGHTMNNKYSYPSGNSNGLVALSPWMQRKTRQILWLKGSFPEPGRKTRHILSYTIGMRPLWKPGPWFSRLHLQDTRPLVLTAPLYQLRIWNLLLLLWSDFAVLKTPHCSIQALPSILNENG